MRKCTAEHYLSIVLLNTSATLPSPQPWLTFLGAQRVVRLLPRIHDVPVQVASINQGKVRTIFLKVMEDIWVLWIVLTEAVMKPHIVQDHNALAGLLPGSNDGYLPTKDLLEHTSNNDWTAASSLSAGHTLNPTHNTKNIRISISIATQNENKNYYYQIIKCTTLRKTA